MMQPPHGNPQLELARGMDSARRAVAGIGSAIGDWFGHGPETADAATATHGEGALHTDAPRSAWGRVGQTLGDAGRAWQQEGVGGLLDPLGALDRQQAQRDLSDRFQVVGDDHAGPRAQNQVSQAEYQRLAGQLSGARRGTGDLRIDSSELARAPADRAAWEQGTQADLADLLMTESGRGQVDALSNNVARDDRGAARRNHFGREIHRATTIAPLFAPGATTHDASTLTEWGAHAEVGQAGHRGLDGKRGEGCDVRVEINPGTVQHLRSDVAIQHELQHALHGTQGTNAPMLECMRNPDVDLQAIGLRRSDTPDGGPVAGDPAGATENAYRRDRTALGDPFIPRTDHGSRLQGPPPPGTDPAALDATWREHDATRAPPAICR